ncbi:hypothetical protein ColLi_06437 [Colletotrichum liriopes]|uniref:Uncharacterized protein n=1 Tax=Colletotrichum liriopes TaxID=708192 RepID=A0AA37GMW8_9PEZI|nr:hypothetical protein ColLi_06437 [Colletotrichum liriopes]
MSNFDLMDPAAQDGAAAAAEASRQFTIEAWTLYGIGVVVTILRTYARAKALFYTIQSTLAHSVGSIARGLANNGMSDEERAALSPDDPEYTLR